MNVNIGDKVKIEAVIVDYQSSHTRDFSHELDDFS